jgi:hypothetical protein
LIGEWPHGNHGSPVWHLHESIDRLRNLCSNWMMVCFGSSGEYRNVGSSSWHGRVEEAFSSIVDKHGTPFSNIHMLRGLKCLEYKYPFHSVDSANIARNHARQMRNKGESAIDMIERFDHLSCPKVFYRKGGSGALSPTLAHKGIHELPLFRNYESQFPSPSTAHTTTR